MSQSVSRFFTPVLLTSFLLVGVGRGEDFSKELRAAGAAMNAVREKSEQLLTEGRLEEANQLLIGVFPETTRTPIQAFMLGNVLFKHSPKISYELHKLAATKLPDFAHAQFEWALQQHRAKEYAGAVEAYRKFLKANPADAVGYGLMAEGLLQTGKVKEAVQAWKDSEAAPVGSLERFESLVCEVNGASFPDVDRSKWLALAKTGDIEAAEKLLGGDLHFQLDWWNKITRDDYLKHDLPLLKSIKFEDSARFQESLATAELYLLKSSKPGALKAAFQKAGFCFDDGRTLPQRAWSLRRQLDLISSQELLSDEECRDRWGEAVWKIAQQSKDSDALHLAAKLFNGTDRFPEANKIGWEFTRDARFAASRFLLLSEEPMIQINDPRLVEIVRAHPRNSMITRRLYEMATANQRPLQTYLVHGILAEYSHFSLNSPLTPRPGARMLRTYFKRLEEELAKAPPQ